MVNDIFHRTELLLGTEALARLAKMRAIVFGIGGVGSWCVEGLVRSGIGSLTMVDPDKVCITNINRQLPALHSTLGLPKVEVMRRRLLDINPKLAVEAVDMAYSEDTASQFHLDDYDIIIDAIDSLSDKALLILNASASGRRFYSSMGAALKIDPLKIQVAEFWKVKGCPLAAALRQRFRKASIFPKRKFHCVFSEELKRNEMPLCEINDGAMTYKKVSVNGTFPTTVAIFGLVLANIAVQDCLNVTDN